MRLFRKVIVYLLIILSVFSLILISSSLLITQILYPDSYSGFKDTKDAILFYDEKEYVSENYWHPTVSMTDVVEKGLWQGYEHHIRVYDDPQKRFIFDELFQSVFHDNSDVLPDFKDIQSIEEIIINFAGFGIPVRSYISLNSELLIKTMVELMGQPYKRVVFKNNSPFEKKVAAIFISFYDYPASHNVATLIQAEDGSYGLRMTDWEETKRFGVGKRDYITIPSDSPIMLYFGEY